MTESLAIVSTEFVSPVPPRAQFGTRYLKLGALENNLANRLRREHRQQQGAGRPELVKAVKSFLEFETHMNPEQRQIFLAVVLHRMVASSPTDIVAARNYVASHETNRKKLALPVDKKRISQLSLLLSH